MRRTERFPVEGSNSLWQVYRTVSFWKVLKNSLVIHLARYTPFLGLKNWMYRTFLGMEVGEKTAFGLMAMIDVMFPERIRIGRNSIIGYNTTLLAHEYLIDEYRLGDVVIGDHVMIGANTTVLPGVVIGDRAVVGAGSVVNRDVPPGAFVAGNPIRVIRQGEEKQEKPEGEAEEKA